MGGVQRACNKVITMYSLKPAKVRVLWEGGRYPGLEYLRIKNEISRSCSELEEHHFIGKYMYNSEFYACIQITYWCFCVLQLQVRLPRYFFNAVYQNRQSTESFPGTLVADAAQVFMYSQGASWFALFPIQLLSQTRCVHHHCQNSSNILQRILAYWEKRYPIHLSLQSPFSPTSKRPFNSTKQASPRHNDYAQRPTLATSAGAFYMCRNILHPHQPPLTPTHAILLHFKLRTIFLKLRQRSYQRKSLEYMYWRSYSP